jgi:phosphate-selective porin OprO/OprP
MKLTKSWLAVALGTQLILTSPAADSTTDTNRDADIEALKQQINALSQKVEALENQQNQQAATNAASNQIQALDQKVRVLARERELDQEAAAAAAKAAPKLSVGSSGFIASSADSNFVFRLNGVLQVDSRTFFNDSANKNANDGFLLRRARPIFQGTLYRDFDFKFTPDFAPSSGPTIFDAYGNYKYASWAQLRTGKFKTPEGLEQLQEDVNTSFNERSLATDLVPNRDVGLQLWGDINGGVLSYAAGIFNGVGDEQNSSNVAVENEVEFAGRLFTQPFKNSDITVLQGFGFGVAGTSQNGTSNAKDLPNTTGGTLPGYTTDGQQQFFAYNPAGRVVSASGEHWRLSPQGYYYYGPLSLLGEYAISDQGVRSTAAAGPTANADLHNTAWEVSGGWILTGENASFNGVTPLHPFDPHNGQWGAFQVVARYAELDIDNAAFPLFANPATSASAAQAWSAGLNWYLNKNIRLNASFSHTTFTGGGGAGVTAPAIVTRQAENVFFTRVQLAF